MSLIQCPWPIWIADDFTECARHNFFELLFPICVACVSALLLASRHIRHCLTPVQNQTSDLFTAPERLRPLQVVLVEGLAIVGVVSVHAVALSLAAHRPRQKFPALTGLMIWLYVLALALLLSILPRPRRRMLQLWNHLTAIYILQWLFKLILFWSAITNSQSTLHQALTISEFSLITFLFGIAATTPKSNGVLSLEWEGGLEPSREPLASLWSWLNFSWAGGLVQKSYKNPVNMQDIWDLVPENKVITVLTEYRKLKKTTKLIWHILYHFRSGFLKQWAYTLPSLWFHFQTVLLLQAFIGCLEEQNKKSPKVMLLYVILLFLINIIPFFIQQHAEWIGHNCGLRIGGILKGEILAKALRRKALPNNNAESEDKEKKDEATPSTQANIGTIINHMSVDAPRVAEIITSLNGLVSAPVKIIYCTRLLWRILSPKSTWSLLIIIPSGFIIAYLSRRINYVRKELMNARNKRIQAITEILQNIRIVKFLALEHRFSRAIDAMRSVELTAQHRLHVNWVIQRVIEDTLPILITLLSFSVYVLVEEKLLYPSVAFPAISLLKTLKSSFSELIDMFMNFEETVGVSNHMENFMEEAETEKYKPPSCITDYEGNEVVGFSNGSFCWGMERTSECTAKICLKDLNIMFLTGRLNIIVGSTGSGKSAMLLALLGEMTRIKGDIYLPKSVAYCAQKPWLKNTSIKKNILFDSELDESRYEDVLIACALHRDLKAFEIGDQTLVGDGGATLSGGQKQRIALARAVYSRHKVLLLDDVLSSIDPQTAKWIIEKCILGALMSQRTCILVTNNTSLCLPHCQFVVALENGKIAIQGTPEVVLSGRLSAVVKRSETTAKSMCKQAPQYSVLCTNQRNSPKDARDESRAVNVVKFDTILLYLKSMGSWLFWLPGILLLGLQPLSGVASNIWIRKWVNEYDPSTPPPLVQGGDVMSYFAIYAVISLSSIFVTSLRYMWIIFGSFTASRQIHQNLVKSVCYATFIFFDLTPAGRLANRFAADITCVDQKVAFNIVAIIGYILSMVIEIALIGTVIPGFLVAVFFIGAVYYRVSTFYIVSSRDLKRLESTQRDLLLQHLNEILIGSTTIRAYGNEQLVMKEGLTLIDNHSRLRIARCAINRRLWLHLQLIGAFIVFFTGIFIILSIKNIGPGSAGLVLTYAIGFTVLLGLLVRSSATLVKYMESVEHIDEYFNIDQEKDTVRSPIVPPANWPVNGSIELHGFTARYGERREPALLNISINVNPGEKVGVVGPTGAGKSSLALALIRGLEAEKGNIMIDGHDICRTPLKQLRESVNLVPQDPTLFTGTIRGNLDPYNRHTDKEIYTALRRVGLIGKLSIDSESSGAPDSATSTMADAFALKPDSNALFSLSTSVAESGDNLSQGERQLLCLARAFLKNSKVLIMDEPTASIDYRTEESIQQTIQDFKGTIISIAHRLQTIINYDKILVLDEGKVVEFGHPYDLLRKRDKGAFFKMCKETGDLEMLQNKAKQSYEAGKLVDDE